MLPHAEVSESGMCRMRAPVVLLPVILMNGLFSSYLDSFYILKFEKRAFKIEVHSAFT